MVLILRREKTTSKHRCSGFAAKEFGYCPKPLPDGCGLKKVCAISALCAISASFLYRKEMGKPLFVFIHHGLPARPGRSPDNVVALVVKELSVMRARLGALLLAANRAHAANLSQGGPRIGCARTYRSRLRAFSVAGDGNVFRFGVPSRLLSHVQSSSFDRQWGVISSVVHLCRASPRCGEVVTCGRNLLPRDAPSRRASSERSGRPRKKYALGERKER
jgi:hypothetical protein